VKTKNSSIILYPSNKAIDADWAREFESEDSSDFEEK